MDTIKVNQNTLTYKDKTYQCAIGERGMNSDKHEGDGTTPIGCFPIRKIYYRVDRLKKIDTVISTQILNKDDGWCDDPKDKNYNKYVKLPYLASSENLWREDNIYNIIVVLGYNDEPIISGKGSAIFMHVARPDYSPTDGCIALSEPDLLEILKEVSKNTLICANK